MISAILWYLTLSLVGWLAFPLAFRLLPGLADRGYAFTRTLGLLLWSYIFWLLASLGILRNDPGGLLFALLILIILSGWALRGTSLEDLRTWLRHHLSLILSVEVLFLVAFIWMGLVRASNPEIAGTEKPMELAFINAILNSPQFPPHDPWLSGYAISYYHFGYIMVSMLAQVSGTPGNVAFNLGIVLVFSLSALGAYGVVYNLLAARNPQAGGVKSIPVNRYLSLALLGPVFVLLVGNAEGFLEVLHARGLFWKTGAGGEMTSSFWPWLDQRELSSPPALPLSWTPSRYLWWWRASRVVQDYDFAGNWKEVIDEFPAFSYVLSDLHPHVLAMPFAFLAMALALNLFLGGGQGRLDWARLRIDMRALSWSAVLLLLGGFALVILGVSGQKWLQASLGILAGMSGGWILTIIPSQARSQGLRMLISDEWGAKEVGGSLPINSSYFLFSVVGLGGLAFLNIWDFPFYVVLFAGANTARRFKVEGLRLWVGVKEFFALALVMGVAGILLYLPFYLGFSSQAGGILPSLVYVTRGAHLWIMFATLWVPLFIYLIWRWKNGHGAWRWQGLALSLGLVLVLLVLMIALAVAISLVPAVSGIFLSNLAAPGLSELLGQSILRRLTQPGGWITLVILLSLTVGLLIKGMGKREREQRKNIDDSVPSPLPIALPPEYFALLLILLGALLVLGPEFFYLRDLFGWRINTIFKFYFQAWLLWGVAAAYVSALLLQSLRRTAGILFGLSLVLTLGMGLTYTVFGIWTQTNGFKPAFGFSLDGTAQRSLQDPDEMAAVKWLKSAPAGVVAEAVGGSYTEFGRVSALSGQPTVLGWDFHEVQWRGSNLLLGSRQSDIMRLYCTRDWTEAEQIVQQYQIRYIFVGNLERRAYTPEVCPGGLDDNKFIRNLPVAFQQGEVTIYSTP